MGKSFKKGQREEKNKKKSYDRKVRRKVKKVNLDEE
jgi:hypothetical protein